MPQRKNPEPRYRLKSHLSVKFGKRGEQARFSREYGVPTSTIRNWLDPDSNMLPNGEQLCDLADFFDTTPYELVHEEPKPEIVEDEQISRIKEMLYELSRDDLDHIEAIVRRMVSAEKDKSAGAEGG